jgi:hypothetical protein
MGKAKINAYGLRGFVDCYKGSLRKPLILANGNVKRLSWIKNTINYFNFHLSCKWALLISID